MSACRCRSRLDAGAGAAPRTTRRVVNDLVVYEGETVVVGDTADPGAQKMFGDVVRYELLCRRHYHLGELGI